PRPTSTIFPYTTLFRSRRCRYFVKGIGSFPQYIHGLDKLGSISRRHQRIEPPLQYFDPGDNRDGDSIRCLIHPPPHLLVLVEQQDRKSTRLNSSHVAIS